MNYFKIGEDVLLLALNIIAAAKHPDMSHGVVSNAVKAMKGLEQIKEDITEK